MPQIITTALIGLGNVGRGFLSLLETKGDRLRQEHNLEFRITCVADSSGVALNSAGFDPIALRQFKEAGNKVAQLPTYLPNHTPASILAEIDCDLLLEASPVNLKTGEPGLSAVRSALGRGINSVLANKGPLALAFAELHEIAKQNNAKLAFSATVCGALPVINIGRRDLLVTEIMLLRGIFNATSNYILGEMEKGRSYAQALREAQQAGIAETDPSLDVKGWDTANKLVIIANSFLGVSVTLADVTVRGITAITSEQLQAELARGNTIKLVASARQVPQSPHYQLTVEPLVLPQKDFLATCHGYDMGVEIHTDIYGIQSYKVWEDTALPTAAAMLRDAVNMTR